MSCEKRGTRVAIVEDPKGTVVETPAVAPVAGKEPAPYFDEAVDWQGGKINQVPPITNPRWLSV